MSADSTCDLLFEILPVAAVERDDAMAKQAVFEDALRSWTSSLACWRVCALGAAGFSGL